MSVSDNVSDNLNSVSLAKCSSPISAEWQKYVPINVGYRGDILTSSRQETLASSTQPACSKTTKKHVSQPTSYTRTDRQVDSGFVGCAWNSSWH